MIHVAARDNVAGLCHFLYPFTLFTMTQPIPNTLRLVRKQAKMTQLEVARKLGFGSTDRICRWEKGRTFPHIVNLFKLCALYQVLPHQLYGDLLLIIERDVRHPSSLYSSLPVQPAASLPESGGF